ncbi:MAG: polyisoprenoid-binding protein [Nevskiaceae bacterium]|nr:MAG: polyisoprenoid-binding protein [Nevskiaceae bacterium]
MKKLLVPLLLAVASASATAAPVTYTLDSSHSFETFQYRHMGLSFVRGRFDKTSGTITLDQAAKTGSADIVIDVNSVNTGVPKLDEHLKGAEFFDTAKFPTITFKSSSFKFNGDTLASVSGDLTIHGVTKPVTLTVSSFVCTEHPFKKVPACAANAEVTIKRSEFGVGNYVPVISDETRLEVGVEAIKE